MIDPPGSGEITLSGRAGQHQAEQPVRPDQLVVFLEGRVWRTLSLDVPVVTIGRTPANVLPLPHPAVSRAHAELRIAPGTIILTDLGSANGTFVGDARLAPQQPVVLTPGSLIRIGPFVLRYEAATVARAGEEAADGSAAAPTAPEPMPLPPAVFVPAAAPRDTSIMPMPNDPISTYLDFLPVIFQDADFLGRFLLIFQSIWEPLEYRQDHIPMYFDPRTCPAPFLSWLADWLGLAVGAQMEEGRLRALLGEAVELHRWRGTRYGLTRMIEICTGVTPVVAEAASNPGVLHIRVALPPEANIDRDSIERIVKSNKPAHTAYLLEVI